jgi:hypothetical protein
MRNGLAMTQFTHNQIAGKLARANSAAAAAAAVRDRVHGSGA